MDGSGERPDFSDSGSEIYFGFIRLNTRSTTLPDYPPEQDLVVEHCSDNFTVEIVQSPPENRKPHPGFDEFFYSDMLYGNPVELPVLENDSDPDGDFIRILSVGEPGFGGEITAFNDSLIAYKHESFWAMGIDTVLFEYTVTDELDTATALVVVRFCDCPIECLYRSATIGYPNPVSGQRSEKYQPVTTSLYQNYPNPFNPRTTIKYKLHKSGHVVLKIYNLSGQEIATLVNEIQAAGEHEITWQPEGLTSGIYLYKLQTGKYSKIKKIIFQK
ncbi:T9SS type A sorting domain-containing protein [candidate division KSB1 bacterium]|nr:T9SS type A sorting domain-containing protein [candidate division KSB1 bacterium]